MKKCDNYTKCHDPKIIGESLSAIYVYCRECGYSQRIGKDKNGNPQHLIYSEWFKRDILQPGAPLYYKYAGKQGIKVA